MNYFLWKADDESYKNLGTHIPEIDIEMALKSENFGTSGHPFTIRHEDQDGKLAAVYDKLRGLNSTGRDTYRPTDMSALQSLSNAIIGELLKYIADNTENGNFLQPFFVRYAYRLFDGSHTMASAPILMIPNSAAPLIRIDGAGHDEKDEKTLVFNNTIIYTPASLLYRILSDTSQLEDWKDIITHIDIFVTPQIYTFDQSADLTSFHRTSATTNRFSHAGSFDGAGTRGDDDYSHRQYAYSDDSSTPRLNYYSPHTNIEMPVSSSNAQFWNLKQKNQKEIEADIQSTYLFYLIASINIDEISPMNNFTPVNIESKTLSTLNNRQQLVDDYLTHHTPIPKSIYPYNARLSIANINLAAFHGFPIRTMSQFTFQDQNANFENVHIYVKLKSGSKTTWIHSHNIVSDTPDKSPFYYDSIENNFPRWLFYPDSSATEIILATTNGFWRLPLRKHDYLQGAYWFRGLSATPPEMIPGNVIDDMEEPDNKIPILNKVYTSEINNPFFFPLSGITSVGTGQIYSIASAAKALSQGQFGQFPLYAFTTEGIWAMEVSPTTGGFAAKQPITRDICINPDAITQIDSAVLFPSERGIMLISGSEVSCISETIDSDFPFLADNLSGLLKNSDALQQSPQILPFKDFLKQCRMAYDYINQRIYLFSPLPDYKYSYVYSMKSKMWGMITASFKNALNSYPEALVVTHNGAVVNLSSPDLSNPHHGLILTRPLKLDAPDILKTVDTVITRGQFTKGHVKTILYGSRDLQHWFPVFSSVDHFLRGFRGTPYKYFRLALICNLLPEETVSSVSVQFTPRQLNRLR